jgi:hypothetical protein
MGAGALMIGGLAGRIASIADGRVTANTALQTAQRARTPSPGTFPGSTR